MLLLACSYSTWFYPVIMTLYAHHSSYGCCPRTVSSAASSTELGEVHTNPTPAQPFKHRSPTRTRPKEKEAHNLFKRDNPHYSSDPSAVLNATGHIASTKTGSNTWSHKSRRATGNIRHSSTEPARSSATVTAQETYRPDQDSQQPKMETAV